MMEISPKTKLIIIEGISGSGKTNLMKEIINSNTNRKIISYSEGELLCSWRHAWVDNIEHLRLELMHKLLDYIKENDNKNELFILDRFHLSAILIPIITKGIDLRNDKRYLDLIDKLRSVEALTLITKSKTIGNFPHPERDAVWQEHMKKRITWGKFKNHFDMAMWEENEIFNLAKDLGLFFKEI